MTLRFGTLPCINLSWTITMANSPQTAAVAMPGARDTVSPLSLDPGVLAPPSVVAMDSRSSCP